MDAQLNYFVHSVDGARYGAWYRVISSDQLEVIGVGMLETAEYAGFSPDSSARSILENFVRKQRGVGLIVPALESADVEETEYAPAQQDSRVRERENGARR